MPQATLHTGLRDVLTNVSSAENSLDVDHLRLAFEAVQEIYGDQKHWSGVPMIEHVTGGLNILLQFQPDEEAMIACLLHHALQVPHYSLTELELQFGSKVRSLVSGVHLLSHVTLHGRRSSINDLRLMLLTVSDDVRTILIALSDRMHLLECIHLFPPEEQRRLCSDVLHLFAPVAARLGIYRLKHRLETHAFLVAYPSDSERLIEQLDQVHKEFGSFLDKTGTAIKDFLAEQGIEVDIEVREKQLYSIFNKLKKKSLTHINDLCDLFALRVIVNTEEECYRVLGLLHRIGRPLPNRFKDYIAFPKPNGYQSLHTTLKQLPHVPTDTSVEVQVRTHKMNREAKFGIAAHWSYKEGGSAANALHEVQLHKMLASQESVEESQGEGSPSLADHIFVLTPQGDVIELPEGATPLDFAFQVHTELGLSFRSAHVNGSIVPLNYQLENGDVVEIQKFRNPHPSPQWMQLLKMASSRSKLKRYLYSNDRPQFIAKGRELINTELRRRSVPPLDAELSIMRKHDGSALSMQQREDILMKIGQGAEKPSSVILHLDAIKNQARLGPTQRKRPRMQRKDSIVEVAGGLPMPIRYAQCCKPLEKKGSISGVINRQGEVMVHREQCRMLKNANQGRIVEVSWR